MSDPTPSPIGLGQTINYVTPNRAYLVQLQRTGPNAWRTIVRPQSTGAPDEQDTGAVDEMTAWRAARLWANLYWAENR